MKKKSKIYILITVFTIISFFIIQYNYDPFDLTYSEQITDVRIYRNTKAWELAFAVKKENVEKIKKIGKENPELLNTVDPFFGAPLIYFAVQNEKV